MTIIAIDPGASGGIAVQSHGAVAVHSMPDTQGDIVDLLEATVIAASREGVPVRAVVELVGGYVGGCGQPGSAMFQFGANCGFILGALAALHVRTELVRPQAWQKALGLGTSKSHASKTAWKNHLKGRAQQLYAGQKVTLKTADALLILEFANQTKTERGPNLLARTNPH